MKLLISGFFVRMGETVLFLYHGGVSELRVAGLLCFRNRDYSRLMATDDLSLFPLQVFLNY